VSILENTHPFMQEGLAPKWWWQLQVTDYGKPRPVAYNVAIALSQDPALAGAPRYDAFCNQVMLCRPVPWDRHPVIPRPWTTSDDTAAMLWLQEQSIMARSPVVREVVDGIAQQGAYHPVIDYFNSLGGFDPRTSIWDGRARVGDADTVGWLTTYCRAEDSPYTRAISACWPLAAVDRIYASPACVPLLVLGGGGAGSDKAAVFRILAGRFHSTFDPLNLRDAPERLRGAWIAQIDQFDAMIRHHGRRGRPPDLRALRGFVGASADHLRDRAGRVRDHERQCIFGAATGGDEDEFRRTGARDWCWVRCGSKIDLDGLARDLDQFWAEGLMRYGAGERPEIELVKAAPKVAGLGEIKDGVTLLKIWLNSNCEVGAEYQVEKEVLYQDHCAWREACGLEPVDIRWFGRLLRAACPGRENYRSGDDGARCQKYLGLRLK
jgi:putative DNA primase/helicase